MSTLLHRALKISSKSKLKEEINRIKEILLDNGYPEDFVLRQMLPASRKDVLPAIQKSFVIYEYKCHCDSRYVGRTAQRLQDRIKQHVPKWLRQHTASQRVQPNRACKQKQLTPERDSAIGQHLLENNQCAANCNDDQFSILDTARSPSQLSLLEASYITVRRPNLCKQKEFVYTLKLFK